MGEDEDDDIKIYEPKKRTAPVRDSSDEREELQLQDLKRSTDGDKRHRNVKKYVDEEEEDE